MRSTSLVLIAMVIVQISLVTSFWVVDTFTSARSIQQIIMQQDEIQFFEGSRRLGSLSGPDLKEITNSLAVVDAAKNLTLKPGNISLTRIQPDAHLNGVDQISVGGEDGPMGVFWCEKEFWVKVRKTLHK